MSPPRSILLDPSFGASFGGGCGKGSPCPTEGSAFPVGETTFGGESTCGGESTFPVGLATRPGRLTVVVDSCVTLVKNWTVVCCRVPKSEDSGSADEVACVKDWTGAVVTSAGLVATVHVAKSKLDPFEMAKGCCLRKSTIELGTVMDAMDAAVDEYTRADQFVGEGRAILLTVATHFAELSVLPSGSSLIPNSRFV